MRNSYKYTKNIVFLRKRRNFMVDYLYRTLFFFAAILVPIIMPADGLPILPPAPQVRAGLLDNGITYYIVTNPTERGPTYPWCRKGDMGMKPIRPPEALR